MDVGAWDNPHWEARALPCPAHQQSVCCHKPPVVNSTPPRLPVSIAQSPLPP